MASRPRSWSTKLISDPFATSGVQILEDLLVILPVTTTATVVRIVGHLGITLSDPADTTVGISQLDLAIGVSAVEAFNASTVPDPNVEADVPARGWLWRERLWLSHNATVQHPMEVRFDLRAMRKVDRGVLYLVSQSANTFGTYGGITLMGLVRSLILT